MHSRTVEMNGGIWYPNFGFGCGIIFLAIFFGGVIKEFLILCFFSTRNQAIVVLTRFVLFCRKLKWVISLKKKSKSGIQFPRLQLLINFSLEINTLHKGAFFKFLFRWIHYYHSSKSTGKETGKTHLYALRQSAVLERLSPIVRAQRLPL